MVDYVGVTSYSSFWCFLISEMNRCLGSFFADGRSIDMEFILFMVPVRFLLRYSEVLKAFVELKSKGFGMEKDLVAFAATVVPFATAPPSSRSSILSRVVVTNSLLEFLIVKGYVIPKRRLFPALRVIFPLVCFWYFLSLRLRLKLFPNENIFCTLFCSVLSF